mgnify:CR=1 FL=1
MGVVNAPPFGRGGLLNIEYRGIEYLNIHDFLVGPPIFNVL